MTWSFSEGVEVPMPTLPSSIIDNIFGKIVALPKVPDFVVVSPTEWDSFILDGQSPSKLMTSVLKA